MTRFMTERFLLRALVADITTLPVDAMVNASNTNWLGGSEEDEVIHRSAGPGLMEACRLLARCETGDAIATSGYLLKARHVIHTVGPVWRGGHAGEADLLASCYRRSLEVAVDLGATSIAFPAISTGIYKYPADLAAAVAVETVKSFLSAESPNLDIFFCCFSEPLCRIYEELLGEEEF